jgi:flagellar biosynthesis/type III secretory pathway protein FliH
MIKYISGDILQSKDEYIAQGVAVGSQEGLGTGLDKESVIGKMQKLLEKIVIQSASVY